MPRLYTPRAHPAAEISTVSTPPAIDAERARTLKRPRGRPTKLLAVTPAAIEELAELGMTDSQIAAALGAGHETVSALRDRPDYAEAFRRGRLAAQIRVLGAIKKYANRREGAADRIFSAKNVAGWTDRQGLDVSGRVELAVTVSYLHPDAPPQPIDITPQSKALPKP